MNRRNLMTLALPCRPPLEYGELAILRADAAGRISIGRRRD